MIARIGSGKKNEEFAGEEEVRRESGKERDYRVRCGGGQMAPAGRPAGSKNKVREESKSMEKYVTGGEEIIVKAIEKIGKEIEENICGRMEKMNGNVMEQIEQIRKEWKEEKQRRDEETRRNKEVWVREKESIERRLEILEWEKEKKERERRRNNITIRGVDKWGENNLEQEVKEFIKEYLELEVEIGKAFKLRIGGGRYIVVAMLENWEQKRDIMRKKRELKERIFIDDDLTKKEREMQGYLREKAKEEKVKGNRAKIGYAKIWVNDKCYWWNEREKRLTEERRMGRD